jgi:hypothetical protein
MSAPPQAIASNPQASLLNVYIQIANKMGFQKNYTAILVTGRSGWGSMLQAAVSCKQSL